MTEAVAASRPIEKLSRLGYAVHGLVYIVIGVLAAKLAWGTRGGRLTDPPDAIQFIRNLPMGEVLVALIAFGLAAYALWRFLQAFSDPDQQGHSVKGLIVRTGRFVSGVGYSALAFFAGQLAWGTAQASKSNTKGAAGILTEPIGLLLGVLVSLILLGVAADDIRKAYTRNFGERFHHDQMGSSVSFASKCAGTWGFAARSLILLFAGGYLLRATLESNPNRVRGFEGVLAGMLSLPYGHWLLGFVAMGLIAYGVFMVQTGLYRKHPF